MFSNPKQIVGALGLREGMRVADFGAGSGVHSLYASESVGRSGQVYAVEVQKGLVKKLEKELKEKGITNTQVIWGDIEREGGTKIADRSIDRVIISGVLWQAEDKLGLIDEVRRVLKEDGLALLIDFTGAHLPDNHKKHHILSQEKAEALFIKRGFKIVETISTGAHQYGIIFRHE